MSTDDNHPAPPISSPTPSRSDQEIYQNRNRARSLVSLGWLFLLVIFALGLAWLLIPRKTELVKRLVEDGRHDRALALFGEDMELANSLEIEAGILAPSAANLEKIIVHSIDRDFDAACQQRILTVIQLTEDPASLREVLQEKRRIIPDSLKPEWLEQLAIRSIQTGHPETAAQVYADLATTTSLNLEQTQAWVVACRYAGQPKKALNVITRYLDSNQLPFTQLDEDLREMTVSLHREVNQGSVAFDLLSEEFAATIEPARRQELVELLATVAAQSERIPDSLPILEAYLAETAAGRLDWRELAEIPDPSNFDPEFLKFAGLLAQNLEWNGRTSDAFNLYRKLAVLGDIDALDRCVTIYPWIDRQGDVTDLLETMVPVVSRDRYTLLLGRLLAERGQFFEAEEIYRAELAGKRAEEAKVWGDLAGILDAQDRFAEARDIYLTALSLDASQHGYRANIARLQVSLGDYQGALETYRTIPEDSHDRKTREDFAMLAKSMNAPEDYVRVLEMKIAAEPGPHTGAYLDMTDAWESIGSPEKAEATLRLGIKHLPESALLSLRLADFLAKHDRRDEAFDHLARNKSSMDKRYASRLLSLGYETGRFSETISLVNSAKLNWSPSERFDLASLYEATGNTSAALSQYQQAAGGEVNAARLQAELAFSRGDLSGAIRGQQHFLSLLKEPDYEAWTFLGDLFRAANRSRDADAAYRTALEHLKKELARKPKGDPTKSEVASFPDLPEAQPSPSS